MTITEVSTERPTPDQAQALFREAKQRRRRRWLVSGLAAAIVVSVSFGFALRSSGGGVGHSQSTTGGANTTPGGPAIKSLSAVTGIAEPCVGLATPTVLAEIPVVVTLSKGTQVVLTQTVVGDHVFRLAARPGRYQLTSNQQYSQPVSVVLDAGTTTHVSLRDHCK
jgi:hypothetical protein